ncbi:MAG: FIST C-terminal domain-containing protein [Kiloniellales bacterium]|nr:FIST C-terminal domain-containing protein [Kiloniellales bacterium]
MTADQETFKAACATGADWTGAAQRCIERLLPAPPGANLGFLYATSELADDLGELVAFLRERSGIANWVGTVGAGVAANGVEHHHEPALSVLVGRFPDESFRVFAPVHDSLEEFRRDHKAWVEREAPLFGVVHGDPRNPHLVEILEGVAAEASAFLVGGLSAAEGSFPQIAGAVTEGGLSGVLFQGALPVAVGLSQGCTPIGAVREITEAEGNVIKQIDGRPALEVFKEDIGELLARDLRRIGGYIYVAFPIAGTDTGDYLVRNLTGIDPERGWIAVGEMVEAGRTLMFCRRDHEAATQDLRRMLNDLKRRGGEHPKAAVYYSCIARGPNLFGSDSEELKIIREELGDLPLAGFYANGEISNNRLYGYTGVLALFL